LLAPFSSHLADADDLAARFGGAREQIAGWRRHREILAMGGAREIGGGPADEGPRDDAADVQRIAQSPRDRA
jgi:hypothetical protein